jgi:hypothetical protein
MTLSVTLYRRRIGTVVSGSIGLKVAAGEICIDRAIQFFFNESAAASGRLEFSREAQVIGTPYPEPSNAFDADAGGTADILDIGKTFLSLK